MILGGHLTCQEGLRFVTVNAVALGYNLVQFRLSGDDNYNPLLITDDTADEYCRRMRGIETYIHLPYQINPCEPDQRRRNFYRAAVRRHIRTAEMIGARGLVLHPGFRKQASEEEAMKRAVQFISETVIEDHPRIFIETDSGSKNGSAVGTIEFF